MQFPIYSLLFRLLLLYKCFLTVNCHGGGDDDEEGGEEDHKNMKLENHDTVDKNKPSVVVLISLDGFRFQYLKRLKSLKPDSFLWKLIENNGVYDSDGLEVTFPSVTFPNHYSLVTGLYQESSGIIANTIIDPSNDVTYDLKLNTPDQKFLYHGESIWNTLKKQKIESACYMWVSCQFLENIKYVPYNKNNNWTNVVENVVNWLKDDVRLITVYWPEPDKPAHVSGPNSRDVETTLMALDENVEYLFNATSDSGFKNLNFIVLSDHGMTEIIDTVVIEIPANSSLFKLGSYGSVFWNVFPVKGKLDDTYSYLKKFANVDVYKRADIPERWHYVHDDLVGEILVVAKLGYTLSQLETNIQKGGGTHGYDPREPEMHGLFIAHGPAFKPMAKLDDMKSVDVYLLICEILGANAAPNNGSKKILSTILDKVYIKNVRYLANAQTSLFVVALSAILVIAFVLVFYLLHRASYLKRQRSVRANQITPSVNGNTPTAIYNRVKQQQSRPLLTSSLEHAVDDSDNESI